MLCPLGCPIGFNMSRLSTGPEFPSRICARGLFGSELLTHDQRIAAPLVRVNGVLREASWNTAIERLASRLTGVMGESGPDSIAIVTEPNRGTHQLEAVARLAEVIGTGSVACAFEPQDWPLGTTVQSASASAIEEANCVVIVGDVFTTHPVMAGTIIDAKFTARGNSLFVIEPRRSNTAWFATSHLQNRPGTEALVLAAILAALQPEPVGEFAWLKSVDAVELASAAGLDQHMVVRVGRAFSAAEKAAIVLAPPARGIADVSLVATLANLLVKAGGTGKALVALPSGGNAIGAADVAARHGWIQVSQLRAGLESGAYKALLCLGTDLPSCYPSAALSKALAAMPLVASVALFRGETESVADIVLPECTWLEDKGVAQLYDRSTVQWSEVALPSWGTLPLTTIIDRLIDRLVAALPVAQRKVEPPIAVPAGAGPSIVERLQRVVKSSGVEAGDLALVTVSASGHAGAGSVTRWMQWARDVFPVGFIELAQDDLREMGVSDGEAVTVKSASGTVDLVARATDRLERGTAAVASYDSAARGLFDWSPAGDGWFPTGPARIAVRKYHSS